MATQSRVTVGLIPEPSCINVPRVQQKGYWARLSPPKAARPVLSVLRNTLPHSFLGRMQQKAYALGFHSIKMEVIVKDRLFSWWASRDVFLSGINSDGRFYFDDCYIHLLRFHEGRQRPPQLVKVYLDVLECKEVNSCLLIKFVTRIANLPLDLYVPTRMGEIYLGVSHLDRRDVQLSDEYSPVMVCSRWGTRADPPLTSVIVSAREFPSILPSMSQRSWHSKQPNKRKYKTLFDPMSVAISRESINISFGWQVSTKPLRELPEDTRKAIVDFSHYITLIQSIPYGCSSLYESRPPPCALPRSTRSEISPMLEAQLRGMEFSKVRPVPPPNRFKHYGKKAPNLNYEVATPKRGTRFTEVGKYIANNNPALLPRPSARRPTPRKEHDPGYVRYKLRNPESTMSYGDWYQVTYIR